MAALAKDLKLNNGKKMPMLGFGTWRAQKGVVGAAVKHALDAGYRHLDCARVYINEKEVGDAIAEYIKAGKIKREDLFITSKLWLTDFDHVAEAMANSIADLGCGYLDQYLIHWPIAWRHPTGEGKSYAERYSGGDDGALMKAIFPKNEEGGHHAIDSIATGQKTIEQVLAETWAQMEALYDPAKDGCARSIGVSNFSEAEITALLKTAKIVPAVNQVEMHAALPQKELLGFCKGKGILLAAYCPLGVPFDETRLPLFKNPALLPIAKMAGPDMTPAQLLLQWHASAGDHVYLSKSVTPERIHENSATSTEPFSEEVKVALEDFAATHGPFRACNPDSFGTKKGDRHF